ncbi:MAG: hypothetical protein KTR14_03615 [Vampirovibrio sp.]|nr:hypothetical protein [Vampirovibrio sp.]
MKCTYCGGRCLKSEEGYKCLNSQCEGSKTIMGGESGVTHCGQTMSYTGMNSYGEPVYNCVECGASAKL